MRAIVYRGFGPVEVLKLVERMSEAPGPGEVRVRVHRSAVNPTDWKLRRGLGGDRLGFAEIVPNQDGAGVVEAVGREVDGLAVGDRVWLVLAQHERSSGTAQELTVVPAARAIPLPANASFDLGAAIGIPAMTAHRALTVGEGGDGRLRPGALAGQTVLVAGGAGAVGNAAIQLARWAGATVIATVSSPDKGHLADLAGANATVNYREADVAARVRELAPGGIDVIAEVSPATNLPLDLEILKPQGTVAVYANDGGDQPTLAVGAALRANARIQGVLLYTLPVARRRAAADDINAAVTAGALDVGAERGLPLHHFPLERTAQAHRAVEDGVTGKVLIDITEEM